MMLAIRAPRISSLLPNSFLWVGHLLLFPQHNLTSWLWMNYLQSHDRVLHAWTDIMQQLFFLSTSYLWLCCTWECLIAIVFICFVLIRYITTSYCDSRTSVLQQLLFILFIAMSSFLFKLINMLKLFNYFFFKVYFCFV